MKKTILTAIMLLSITGSCFAADTKNINKEINTTENFANIIFNISSDNNDYQKLTRNFTQTLKNNFPEQKYEALKKTLKNRCGNIKNINFKLLQRENNGDIVLFTADSSKAGPILINLYFDKEGKVLNYGVSTAKK